MKFKLFAKKSLGQHFLNSTHVLEQIIRAAHIEQGQVVLEIGPGTGILTRALLSAGAEVVAVEKDARSVPILNETFKQEVSTGRLRILEGDVLTIPNDRFPLIGDRQHFSIVANIPYYITGAILERFLEKGPRPDRMILLVQKEVADRIVAKDGKESILSVSVKAFGVPSIIAKIPPGAFTPPPSVDSAILRIDTISDSLFRENNMSPERFFSLIKAGFAHKRKILMRNLETVIDRASILEIWMQCGLDPNLRAEDVSLEQWTQIMKRAFNL